MMRWPRTRTHAALIDENPMLDQAIGALMACHFLVDDFRQSRETQQTPGVADLYVLQPHRPIGGCWVEGKRPQIVLGGKIVQRRGQRSWEQERWQRRHLEAGDKVLTIESAAMVLAGLAAYGYDIPAEMLTEPWDPASWHWYTNPHARPHVATRRTRKVPRQTAIGLVR